MRQLFGNDTRVVIDNAGENELPETDEYEAIADIENTLGIAVPEFMYRPNGFKYCNYTVDKYSQIAWIEYEYKESIIFLKVDKNDVNGGSTVDSLHGEQEETIDIISEDINAVVKQIQGAEDIRPSYSARWEKDNIIYQFSGKMEKNYFYRMVQEISY